MKGLKSLPGSALGGLFNRSRLALLLVLSCLGLALAACAPLTGVKGGNVDVEVPQPLPPPLVTQVTYATMIGTVGKSTVPVFLEEYDPLMCDAACVKQHQVVEEAAAYFREKKVDIRFYRVTTDESEFQTDVAVVFPIYYIVGPRLRLIDADYGVKTKEELIKFVEEALGLPPSVVTP